MAPWLVLGCGYTGEHLVRRLTDCCAVRRDAAALAALAAAVPGVRTAVADAGDAGAVAGLTEEGAIVVMLAPPTGTEGGVVEAVARAGAARVVYVSSTGVYAPGGGARVDEEWPLEPVTSSGRARLAAERAVREAGERAGISVVVLRPAGIYGPGRGVAARLRAGTFRVVGDGTAHTSRVHVEDLAAAIALAGEATAPRAIYNVADDDPCPLGEHADAAAARLGLPPPPRVAADTVDAEVAGMLLADRRIDASRLRELGWAPRYPSWRDAPL